MKRLVLLTLLTALTSPVRADYASSVLAHGPIAYWRLNETTQPPAGDMAANSGSLASAADGFYVGDVFRPETGAIVGSPSDTAASFTGGARVTVPYSADLNPSGAFSVECWALKDPGTGYPLGAFSSVQYNGGSERRGWLIYDNDTNWQFRVGDGAGYVATAGGGTADVGAWYHLVGVCDGTNAKLYVNGEEVANVALARPFEPNPSASTDIGSASAFGRHFTGVVDEAAVYPTALSAAEVLAHYQNGINSAPTTPYSQLVQAQNPLAYWHLNEPAYTPPTSLPSAANLGSDGAASNGSYQPGSQPGAPGSTLSGFGADNKSTAFNGIVGHVETPVSLNNLAEFTVMGWIKRGSEHSTRGGYFGQNDLLEFGDADGGTTIEAWINAYGANIKIDYPFPDDTWGFIALTGNSTEAVLYVNGIPAASRTGSVTSFGSSAYLFNIGGGGIFNATGDYFRGGIDEVAVFDKALSAAQVLEVFAGANVPPWITTQPIAPDRDLYAGNTVTVSVGAEGPPPLTYQWFKDGAAVTGQTSDTLTLSPAAVSDSGTYEVVVSNTYGQATSDSVSILINPADTVAPTLLHATGNDMFNQVRVWFSEPVDPASAQNPANYSLSGGLSISAATLDTPAGGSGDHIVTLSTSAQTPGQIYTLTVSGVQDQVLPANTIAANSTIEFSSWIIYSGYLKFEVWNGLSTSDNNLPNTLLADPRFPDSPDMVTYATEFSSRTVYPDDSHEGYGGKMSGFIIPTETADYTFFLSSDDSSQLYLSTSDDPADAVLIAEETDCCDAFQEPDVPNDDGTTYSSSFPAVTLQAGQRYYIEALWKEGGGGDYCRVAWRKSGDSTLAADLPHISGANIAVPIDPNVDMAFTQQPADQLGILPSTGIEIFAQDFNANDGGFTVVNTDPAPPGPWVYNAANGTWTANGGEADCTGPYNSQLNSPAISLTQDGALSLNFSHRYSFESGLWDAGQVRISVNGGAFTLVPAENFSANGYAEGAIVGSGIALGQRAFNGDSPGYSSGTLITSKCTLGTFSQGDSLVVQFVGAWDDCTTASTPGWVIDSLQLELLPMMIQNFAADNGGFSVADSPSPAPAGRSPWTYDGTSGLWTTDGSNADCTDPFSSGLTSPAYTVPVSEEVTLNFNHRYSFEGDLWDGGQVRISVNGGAFNPVAAESFTANGYAPGTIQGTGVLNGQSAFNGDSTGYANGDTITSSAILGSFNQNDTIAIQFIGAWDECSGASTPSWAVNELSLVFGTAAQASTFTAQVQASLQGEPVSVNYQWQRNDGSGWIDIDGADTSSFTIYPTPADFQASFRVTASVPGKSITSNEVMLVTEVTGPPALDISKSASSITITFEGTLQSAPTAEGPYTTVQGAQSPYTVPLTEQSMFLRSVR
ncbi:MAG: hypothetical protein RI897_493 [Verrucomicrobiota bacterium]|jgi:hypothetical protein